MQLGKKNSTRNGVDHLPWNRKQKLDDSPEPNVIFGGNLIGRL